MADTFFDECVLIADRFIRTICFIDDQPFFREGEDPVNEDIDHRLNADLITKSFALEGKASSFYRYGNKAEENSILNLINNSDVTVLDWKIVLDDNEINATPLASLDNNHEFDPSAKKVEVTSETQQSITSFSPTSNDEDDIPEDESRGKYAIMLLDKILTQKHATPKLILIYTAEIDFEGIFNAIRQKLNDLNIQYEHDADDLWFQNEKIRISIFFKKTSEVIGRHLSDEVKRKNIGFSDLPKIVNEEFARINNGLIANVVLKTLTAIRNETIQVLNTFSKLIDPAFLAHRSMLPHPDDSEEHALDIIGSEIKAIIKGGEKGSYIPIGIIKKYVEENYEDKDYEWNFEGKDKFNLEEDLELISNKRLEPQELVSDLQELTKQQEIPSEQPSVKTYILEDNPMNKNKSQGIIPEKISRDLLIKFNEVGIEQYFIKRETPTHKKIIFSSNYYKTLTNLFSENENTADESNNLFAKLTTVKSQYNNSVPMLTQGTILKHKSEYWVCIQPKCDTVRINKTREFLFGSLKLVKKSDRFDIVLKNENDYMYFKIDYTIHKTKFVTFKANSNQSVKAEIEGSKFTMGANPKMDWLGELKSDYAQSIANNFAAYLSRVGMDHSEWLRRSS